MLRGLDPPASGGVASRPRTAMGGIHAHSGCRDRSVPGRLPVAPAGASSAPPPQGYQSDAAFAASAAAKGVVNVSATTQRVSCYAPEALYLDALLPTDGYPDEAARRAPGPPRRARTSVRTPRKTSPTPRCASRTTRNRTCASTPPNPTSPDRAEQVGGQRRGLQPPPRVLRVLRRRRRHGPCRATSPATRVGPTTPTQSARSTLGQLLLARPAVPVLLRQRRRPQVPTTAPTRPTRPCLRRPSPSRLIRPTLPGTTPPPASWITTHGGHPDYLMTAKNANTNDPDKQWIAIDTNPASRTTGASTRCGRLFVFNPSVIFSPHARREARRDAHRLVRPRRSCRRRRASAGTPICCRTCARWHRVVDHDEQPGGQGLRRRRHQPHLVHRGGASWQGPLPVTKNIAVPTYQNTTFREGIVNTFGVGPEEGERSLSALRLLGGRDHRAVHHLPDRLHRRGPYVVDADPGQRQRRRHGGSAAQPGRRPRRDGGRRVL